MSTVKAFLFGMAFVMLMGAMSTLSTSGPQSTSTPSSRADLTTGTPPIVINGTMSSTVKTIVSGTGSPYIAYSLTNEDAAAGFRCEYGGLEGQPPTTAPTTAVGSLVAAGITIVEKTDPNNRLDCIAVTGTPAYDITLYPK